MEDRKKVEVFDYEQVSDFLEGMLSSAEFGRGSRSVLAEERGVQASFVSLVTKQRSSLSLEQGLKVTRFFKLDDEESRYFMTLLQIERAGSSELKQYFVSEKKKILSRRMKVKNRIQVSESVSLEDQLTYYSHAFYAIIHIFAALPEYKTSKKMGETLGLTQEQLKPYLLFLLKSGFIIKEKEGFYQIGKTRIHLPDGSPALPQHHSTLRIQAINSFGHYRPDHLHYSAVLGLTKADYLKIREILMKAIASSERVLSKSSPEIPVVFNIDWFQL